MIWVKVNTCCKFITSAAIPFSVLEEGQKHKERMEGFLSSPFFYHVCVRPSFLTRCEGSKAAVIEVRGQRSGWPSPLCVISPVVIWLAETPASLVNLISKPGGRLGQITFLLGADWTYGEINVLSYDSKRSDCFRWLRLCCVTQRGTQLAYGNIIVLQVDEWSYCPNIINVLECISAGSETETAISNIALCVALCSRVLYLCCTFVTAGT